MRPSKALCVFAALPVIAAFRVDGMRTEYLVNPLGLDTPNPRFTWTMVASSEPGEARGLAQASFRIAVHEVGGAPVWDSGDVASPVAALVKYAGAPLKSGGEYRWNVTVRSNGGATAASASAIFSMGLLSRADWKGSFVGMASADPQQVEAPWIRKTFPLPAGSLGGSGLLYVASIGFCDVSVNGQAASEAVLSPSISYLPSRVLYRTYNVTHLLVPGANNTIGLWASAGWAAYFSFSWANGTQWPRAPLVMAELRVGGEVVAATDGSWECRKSTVSRLGRWGDGGFGGDAVDDNLSQPGW